MLKMINTRYSNDMLMRHKKKEGLEKLIEAKNNSLETLKVYYVINNIYTNVEL